MISTDEVSAGQSPAAGLVPTAQTAGAIPARIRAWIDSETGSLSDVLEMIEDAAPAAGTSRDHALGPIVAALFDSNLRNPHSAKACVERELASHLLQQGYERTGTVLQMPGAAGDLVRSILESQHVDVHEWLDLAAEVYGAQSPTFTKSLAEALCLESCGCYMTDDGLAGGAAYVLRKGWMGPAQAKSFLVGMLQPNKQDWYHNPKTPVPFIDALVKMSINDPFRCGLFVRALAETGIKFNDRLSTSVRTPDQGEENAETIETWEGTLLHKVIEEGSVQLASELLELGCDPAAKQLIRKEAAYGTTTLEQDCFQLLRNAPESVKLPERKRLDGMSALLRSWRARQVVHATLGQVDGQAPSRLPGAAP